MDKLLFSNEPVAAIAKDFGFSESSVRRHARNHIHATILSELRASRDVSAVDLLERLTEAFEDVSAVRSAALMSGQSAVLLRAAAATESLFRTLSEALAPNGDLGTAKLLRAGDTLARAVGQAVQRDPALAVPIAARLRELNDPETAAALERAAAIAQKEK